MSCFANAQHRTVTRKHVEYVFDRKPECLSRSTIGCLLKTCHRVNCRSSPFLEHRQYSASWQPDDDELHSLEEAVDRVSRSYVQGLQVMVSRTASPKWYGFDDCCENEQRIWNKNTGHPHGLSVETIPKFW